PHHHRPDPGRYCSGGPAFASPSSCSVLFFIGALSFLISDLNTSGPRHQQKLRIVNLSLYYIGQLLIALNLQFLL
ncbi:lysoplasmalogenase family protein, partial [Sphaerochaeta sp. UBA5856]|uniref:lysoplasmalogenase family protein n=1 Tax=Sphaerochaeta sp. UBA5856 TaxID=1947476 RepID=UPI0025DE95C5